jgi:hypothetical protein
MFVQADSSKGSSLVHKTYAWVKINFAYIRLKSGAFSQLLLEEHLIK